MNRLGTARVQHDGFSRILPMGTRQNSPGWEPTRDLAPPLLLPPSMIARSAATLRGPGPASLPERYGKRKRYIDSGVPFGRAPGFFVGRLTGRDGRSRHSGQQVMPGGHEDRKPRGHEISLRCRRHSSRRGCRTGFAAPRAVAAVASLNKWRLSRARRRTES